MSMVINESICEKCNRSLVFHENAFYCPRCGEEKSKEIFHDEQISINDDGTTNYGPKIRQGRKIQGGENVTLNINNRKIKQSKFVAEDKIQLKAINTIENYVRLFNFNSAVEDDSNTIFIKLRKKELIKGRRTEEVVAGIVYTVAKHHNISRTLGEFSSKTKIKKSKITQMSHLVLENIEGLQQNVTLPQYYIPKIRNFVSFNTKTERMAIDILSKYPQKEGKAPGIMMAAAIWLASQNTSSQKITQRDLAESINCQEISIRNRVVDMKKFISLGDSK